MDRTFAALMLGGPHGAIAALLFGMSHQWAFLIVWGLPAIAIARDLWRSRPAALDRLEAEWNQRGSDAI
jgi:hypothetical protein